MPRWTSRCIHRRPLKRDRLLSCITYQKTFRACYTACHNVMDVDAEDEEVVAEYPLYAASIRAIYNQQEDMRLVQLQYPLRPPWRGYDFEHVKEVTYKPIHRVVHVTLPEDQPAGVRASQTHNRLKMACGTLPHAETELQKNCQDSSTPLCTEGGIRHLAIWARQGARCSCLCHVQG
jgi:hypothetical protein